MTIEITKGPNNLELTRGYIEVNIPRRSSSVDLAKGDNEVNVSRPNFEVGITKNEDDLCQVSLTPSEVPAINVARAESDLTLVREELHTDILKHSHLIDIVRDYPEFLLQLQSVVYSSTTIENQKYNIELIGLKNGSNLVYTTPDKFIPDSIRYYRNGIRQFLGSGYDYTVSEGGGPGTGYDTITLEPCPAPLSWENLLVDYIEVT